METIREQWVLAARSGLRDSGINQFPDLAKTVQIPETA